MEITIEEAIDVVEYLKTQNPQLLSLDVALETMHKYQKIKQVLDNWENSGQEDDPINILDSIIEVVEDGNNDN